VLVQECQGVPSSSLPPRAARAQQGVGMRLGRRDIDEEVLQQGDEEEEEEEEEEGEEEEEVSVFWAKEQGVLIERGEQLLSRLRHLNRMREAWNQGLSALGRPGTHTHKSPMTFYSKKAWNQGLSALGGGQTSVPLGGDKRQHPW
jgi:hypothetical protein